jgi:hypothetical protein
MGDDERTMMESLVPVYTSDSTDRYSDLISSGKYDPRHSPGGVAKPYPWEHSPLDGPFFDIEKHAPLRIVPDESGVWIKAPTSTPPPKSGIYHLTDSDLNDIRMIVRDELKRALGIIMEEHG